MHEVYAYFIRNFGWWLVLVATGLMAVALSPQGWMYFLPLPLLITGMSAFFHRKDKRRLWQAVVVNGLMGLVIFVAII